MSIDVAAPASTLTEQVARRIRARLGEDEISRSELARRLGVDDTWVGKRLKGRTEISLNDLERIAKALGVTPTSLMPRSLGDTETSHRSLPSRPPRRPADRRPAGRPAASTTRPSGQRRTSLIA